jgi:hypothetical protein
VSVPEPLLDIRFCPPSRISLCCKHPHPHRCLNLIAQCPNLTAACGCTRTWMKSATWWKKAFGWQRQRVPFPPLSSLAIIHTREFKIAWCRILPRCSPTKLVTSTGAKASANGSDSNMDHYFFPNQVAAGASEVRVRQVISGEDKVVSTGTNSHRLSWKSVKWIKSLTINYTSLSRVYSQ